MSKKAEKDNAPIGFRAIDKIAIIYLKMAHNRISTNLSIINDDETVYVYYKKKLIFEFTVFEPVIYLLRMDLNLDTLYVMTIRHLLFHKKIRMTLRLTKKVK